MCGSFAIASVKLLIKTNTNTFLILFSVRLFVFVTYKKLTNVLGRVSIQCQVMNLDLTDLCKILTGLLVTLSEAV